MVPPDLLEELLQAALSIEILEDVAGVWARHELDGRGVQRTFYLDALSGAAFDRLQHVQRRGEKGEENVFLGVRPSGRVALSSLAGVWLVHMACGELRVWR